jgi:cell division septum initiation protein DivIVA
MRFALALCETCNGTGEVTIESHCCDCPDCLGTSYVQPQRRILNLQFDIRGLEQQLNQKTQQLESVTAHRDALVAAAQAVIERWESPLWKDTTPTASLINKLANVLDQP